MVESRKVKIPRLTGDKERKAYIYLPVGYGSGQKYPVLYMFDGHNLFDDNEATFGKSWGLSEYLDYTNTPLIVAAVECNHEGHSRLSEYSPVSFTFKDGTPVKGRGRQYMDWLVGEFKPYIDANYNTLPDRANTFIGGSSMGGLMTLFALAKYPKYFSKGAALSPSLWVEGEFELPDFIKTSKFRKDTTVYMDYGSREFNNHETQRTAFAETCAYLLKGGVYLTARVVEGGTHTEASWEKQIPYFMRCFGF